MSVAETATRKFRKQFSEENPVAERQLEDGPTSCVAPRTVFASSRNSSWGVILAGGDGTRLRALTRLICGDDRPKQFCPLTSNDTLLEQTRKRLEQIIRPTRLLVLLTSSHSPYYVAERGVGSDQRIVQPADKGTAPPIIYSLLSIEQQDAEAIVAILPCDHYYRDEAEFSAALDFAFDVAASRSDSVVLLGACPQGPEVEYGWIALGPCLAGHDAQLFGVDRVSESPSFRAAQQLFESGSLWNTFVMVGHVRAFIDMVSAALPDLVALLRDSTLWSGSEMQIPQSLYDRLPPADFSRDVLSTQTSRLLALRTEHSGWSHLSRPERVMALLHETGLLPRWMKPRQRQAVQVDASHETPLIKAGKGSPTKREVTYGN